ncbi:MAG: secondary thiamine-phosphate synthase enzyme YjbQ [Candidatus Omnitrophica bacterium]|nr:secondary thiamine-phosphate synthase enzyme YjbQ [Candidatus Omnitrophota bacterium]
MDIINKTIEISTKGETDIVDITGEVQKLFDQAALNKGLCTVFVPGATGGVSTIEFEPGVVRDIKDALEKVAPREAFYSHNTKWGDGNGVAHVRAALMKPSLSIPFSGGALSLGTWQQIVFMDFDTRPRQRSIVVQFIGV